MLNNYLTRLIILSQYPHLTHPQISEVIGIVYNLQDVIGTINLGTYHKTPSKINRVIGLLEEALSELRHSHTQ